MENIVSGQSFNGKMSEEEKQDRREQAEQAMHNFLCALGYDVDNDPNMKDSPRRITKVFLDEICKGTYEKEPKITVFENQNKYDGIVFEGNCKVHSLCSHHFAFIKGKCHIAYIPGDSVVGISKLNRVVDWFSRRPQLQEQLTTQIHEYLDKVLVGNKGVAVWVEAVHSCVEMRGVENEGGMTTTSKLSGSFLDNADRSREELMQMISRLK
jgi:GTP cyclohydrolase I